MKKQRLMELAGLQERTVTDRDTIAHFVWGHDLFADSGEDEIEDVIDTLTAEWDESQDNYATGAVEDYLEDLEQQGGLEGMLAEAVINEVSKAKLMKDIKAARNFASTDIEKDFVDEIEKNIGNWNWVNGIFLALGSINIAVATRLTVSDMEDILPLMKKYKMNLDAPSNYSRTDLSHSLVLRLYYN